MAVSQITLQNSLAILPGEGRNVVLAYGIDLPAGAIAIESGSGSDLVAISTVRGAPAIRITTGGGDDTVSPMRNDPGGIAAQSLSIDLGDGQDRATLAPLQVRGDVTVMGRGGADVLRISASSIGGALRADLGHGANSLWLATVAVGTSIDIATGMHDDWVEITDTSSFGLFRVQTGASHDTLTIRDASFGSLDIAMGGGNDLLWLGAVALREIVQCDGGDGIDEVSYQIRPFRAAHFSGFERRIAR
jgi:hypothetical protein